MRLSVPVHVHVINRVGDRHQMVLQHLGDLTAQQRLIVRVAIIGHHCLQDQGYEQEVGAHVAIFEDQSQRLAADHQAHILQGFFPLILHDFDHGVVNSRFLSNQLHLIARAIAHLR